MHNPIGGDTPAEGALARAARSHTRGAAGEAGRAPSADTCTRRAHKAAYGNAFRHARAPAALDTHTCLPYGARVRKCISTFGHAQRTPTGMRIAMRGRTWDSGNSTARARLGAEAASDAATSAAPAAPAAAAAAAAAPAAAAPLMCRAGPARTSASSASARCSIRTRISRMGGAHPGMQNAKRAHT